VTGTERWRAALDFLISDTPDGLARSTPKSSTSFIAPPAYLDRPLPR
jgi:hypothetical protein